MGGWKKKLKDGNNVQNIIRKEGKQEGRKEE